VQILSSTSPVKEKAVKKKLKKTGGRRVDGIEISRESEKMAEIVPMKLKKKAGKCTVMEPEAVSKRINALNYMATSLLKAMVQAHLWKCQLDEGKHASVRELSTTVNISIRCILQIVRLNYTDLQSRNSINEISTLWIFCGC
jgi:hypothetical protein